MPRRYSLGKRADTVAETRRRILDAAASLYAEQGISTTTMLDVARRADVAPNTVANHFGSAEGLAEAMGARVLEELELPTTAIFAGQRSVDARIRILIRELAAFYARGDAWYRVWSSEPPDSAAWVSLNERYYREFGALVRAALGPRLAADDETVMVTSALLGWAPLQGFRDIGRSTEDAADLVAEVTSAWLRTRRR